MNTDLIIFGLKTACKKPLCAQTVEPDTHGWTPLHAAVALGDERKVKELLTDENTSRRLLNASNYDGWTPLHVAAAINGDFSVCDETGNDDSKRNVLKQLTDKGADRNARNKDGWTPLHVAVAINCKEEAMKKLLNGAAARASEVKDAKGRTPLHVAAAKNENPEVIKLLLKCCSVHPCTKTKECESSHQPATVKRFTVAVNARNKDGCTPLHRAAKKTKNSEIVKVLLDHCADPRLKDGKGRLPIDLAEKNETLRGTEVYWELHDARYLPHGTWDHPCEVQHCCCGCAPSRDKAGE